MRNLASKVFGIEFKNPVLAASGTYAYGSEMSLYYPNAELGGIMLKGVTLKPRLGNPPPRIAETPSGVLNSVGLQNPGIDVFLDEILPSLKHDTVLFANASADNTDDFLELISRLSASDIDIIELNISCPNIHKDGVSLSVSPESTLDITKAVRSVCKKPLVVKLSPNTSDIRETALAAQQGGADGVSLINTVTGMAVNVHTRRPVMANVIGGLSGAAIFPVALRMVYQVSRAVDIPVIGMGGVMSGEDAIAMMLCGASLVAVGTATLINPFACVEIIGGIRDYLESHDIENIESLIGGLEI